MGTAQPNKQNKHTDTSLRSDCLENSQPQIPSSKEMFRSKINSGVQFMKDGHLILPDHVLTKWMSTEKLSGDAFSENNNMHELLDMLLDMLRIYVHVSVYRSISIYRNESIFDYYPKYSTIILFQKTKQKGKQA